MTRTWIQALKVYNQGKPCWCIPRKGSPGYEDVRALMGETAKAPSDKRKFWDTLKDKPQAAKAKPGKTRFLADNDDDYKVEGFDYKGEIQALKQVRAIVNEFGGGSAARAERKAAISAPLVSFDAPTVSDKPVNIIVPRRKAK